MPPLPFEIGVILDEIYAPPSPRGAAFAWGGGRKTEGLIMFAGTVRAEKYAMKKPDSRNETRQHSEDLAPSEVRRWILSEHKYLRTLLRDIEGPARRRLEAPTSQEEDDELIDQIHRIYLFLLDHMLLEDDVLAPALRQADGFGDARASELLRHHREQRTEFQALLSNLETGSEGAEVSARRMIQLIPLLLADIESEERDLLSPDLLRDDVIQADIFTG